MLRDPYAIGADAKLQRGFGTPDPAVLTNLLPQEKRDVLQPEYDEIVGRREGRSPEKIASAAPIDSD